MILFCTAVERAVCNNHKLLHTDRVSTSLTFIVLAVADSLFGLYGSEHRDELFLSTPHPFPIIIMKYIYHVLINGLSTHMIHINLNMIFYTHVEHSPTKTIYIKYYTERQTKTHTHTGMHTHTHTQTTMNSNVHATCGFSAFYASQ